MHLDRKFLDKLFKGWSGATAGKLMRRVDDFVKAGLISHNDGELLKAQLTNVIHESSRELSNNMKFYNEGRVYKKYRIYKPPAEE